MNRLAHLPDDAESRCRVFLDILQLKPTISELSEASELQPIAMLSSAELHSAAGKGRSSRRKNDTSHIRNDVNEYRSSPEVSFRLRVL